MSTRNKTTYTGALMTDAQPASVTRQKFPLPKDSPIRKAAYQFDVDFMCQLDGVFPPADFNTLASAAAFHALTGSGQKDTNAILTDYTEPQDLGGGVGRWTGTFTRVPASWDSFQTSNVTFPGWINTVASGLSRAAKTRDVTLRTRYDYFVLDASNILNGAGVLDSGGNAITRVTSLGAIPTISRNVWLSTLGGVAQPNSDDNDLVPAGGATVGTSTYQPTFPSLDLYRQWCAVATAFLAGSVAWDATHPPAWDGASSAATSGQFIISNSKLIPHAGQIIARATPYALFQ